MSASVPIAMGDVEMGVMLGIKVQSVKYVSTCVSYAVNQIWFGMRMFCDPLVTNSSLIYKKYNRLPVC